MELREEQAINERLTRARRFASQQRDAPNRELTQRLDLAFVGNHLRTTASAVQEGGNGRRN
jgi:hypothetical protein